MSSSGNIYIDGEIQRVRGPSAFFELPRPGLGDWQPVLLDNGVVVAWDTRISRWVPYWLKNYRVVVTLEAEGYVAGSPPAGWVEVIPAGCSISTSPGSLAQLRLDGATIIQDFYFRTRVPGAVGNDITIQVELTADVGLFVELVGTAVRFYGDAVLTSDCAAYQGVIAASPAVDALIELYSVNPTDKLLAPSGPTNLAWGADVPEIILDAAAAGDVRLNYTIPVADRLGVDEDYSFVAAGYVSGPGVGSGGGATNLNYSRVAATVPNTSCGFRWGFGGTSGLGASGLVGVGTLYSEAEISEPSELAFLAPKYLSGRSQSGVRLDGDQRWSLRPSAQTGGAGFNLLEFLARMAIRRTTFHLRHVTVYGGSLL